ncbi:MAG: hypothetical protein U9N54_12095 [candidate division Zixibacteria bacterium]|nr:hypothetical protein [candidate division Zixibacteria bacterium]
MRKLLIILLALILAVPLTFARRPRSKSGEVEKMVFTDKKHDFQITLLEDWKYSIKKNEDDFRIVLTKKNYEIPPDYLDAPDYTMVPRIVLWVGEDKMSPFQFIDSLISDSYDSDNKGEIKKEFEILNDNISEQGNVRNELSTRKKKAMEINDKKAFLWTGQMIYRKDIAESASSVGGKRVNGKYGGAIVVLKDEKQVFAFHLICEWNYFETNLNELMKVVSSFKL